MRIRTSFTVFVVIATIGLMALSASGQDQSRLFPPNEEISRAGKMEFFTILHYNAGASATAPGGAVLEFDGGFGGGFGLGANLTDHLNLNFEAILGQGGFTFTNGTPPAADPHMFSLLVNLDYNVSKTRFTPVLSAGVGVWKLDGPYPGLSNTRIAEEHFAYNFGAGFRWDVTPSHFLKFMYRRVVSRIKSFDDHHEFDTFNFYVGVTF